MSTGQAEAAAAIARARERALERGRAEGVRTPVRDSWQRAMGVGLDPDRHLPPVPLGDGDVTGLRRDHPLATVWELFLDTFRGVAGEPGQVIFMTDAEGRILWADGERPTLRMAERVHLVPGADWSEAGAGTCAVGTTLVLQRPFQVFGPEHYLSSVTGFVCSAAPIRDPISGAVLGTIDLTCAMDRSRSLALHLVAAAARLAQAQLQTLSQGQLIRLHDRYTERVAHRSGSRTALVTPEGRVLRDDPRGWLPRDIPGPVEEGLMTMPNGERLVAERLGTSGALIVSAANPTIEAYDGIEISTLGRDRASLLVDGTRHELTARHSDIVVLLAASPSGMSSAALAHELYGTSGKTVSVRAEMTRLRRLLGYRLESGPYRLRGDVRADFMVLDGELPHVPLAAMLDRYPGPILPATRAPGVRVLQATLHERVRVRILEAADRDALVRWNGRSDGRDDPAVGSALARLRAG